MSRVRRSFAALFGVLLLQLTLLGSGTLCALHHATQRGGAAHVMHGMSEPSGIDASGSATAVISDAGSRPVNPEDCGGLGSHDGCGSPWVPGQCASMSACVVSMSPAAPVDASDGIQVVALAEPTASIIHAGPTFAPELPPPRA